MTRSQPSPQRRRFIALAGGGIVAAAAVPSLLAGCAGMPDAALRPWTEMPAAGADPRRWILAHALLAPNPHNRQPWIADLRRDGEITLVCDGSRLLPETDPFGRQILIGCGAFVELAVIAAAERGLRADVAAFPAGAPAATALPAGTAVARIVLTPDAGIGRDPLFAQIRRRRTNKSAYDGGRAIDAAARDALLGAARAPGLGAGTVDDAPRRAEIAAITRAAYEIESTTPRTWLESARLLRIGSADIERHRDGISVTGTMPWLLRGVGLFDPLEVPVAGSANHRRVMERWAPFETGSGYVWLASDADSRAAQLAAGRAWVRMQLQATAAGVDLHPLSQALQEFAEVRPQHAQLMRVVGLDPRSSTLQMLARAGYASAPAAHAPRRDAADLVRA